MTSLDPSASAPKILLTAGPRGTIHMKVPPGVRRIRDSLTPGLDILIGKTKRTYAVKLRVKGRPGQLVVRLGDVDQMDLKDARLQARAAIDDARRGILPEQASERREQARRAEAAAARKAELEAERAQSVTFKSVADDYLADKLPGGGGRLASQPELKRKLEKELKGWHKRPIAEITRAEIKTLARTKAKASETSANRLLSFIKRVFAWAEDQDIIDDNPALGVKKPGAEAERMRYLEDDEIRLFWKAADTIPEPAGRLFQLCLVTGQRRGEVGGLRRSELGEFRFKDREGKASSVKAWLLPAGRTKRRRDHAVPLSPLAQAIIAGVPALKSEQGEVTDHVFATAGHRDQAPSGWSKFKRALDEAIGRLIAEEAGEDFDAARHRLADWHIHDLRATCATHLDMEEVDSQTISRILNHAEGDSKSITKRYKRYAYDREASEALNLWAEKLERLTQARRDTAPPSLFAFNDPVRVSAQRQAV